MKTISVSQLIDDSPLEEDVEINKKKFSKFKKDADCENDTDRIPVVQGKETTNGTVKNCLIC